MIYEYKCAFCGNVFDVWKLARDYDREETCAKCNLVAERQWSSRIQLHGTKVQEAEYNPGLGCVVKNKQERAEICKQRGLIELGSEPAESLHKHYDRAREDRRERAWAEADKGWVGNGE